MSEPDPEAFKCLCPLQDATPGRLLRGAVQLAKVGGGPGGGKGCSPGNAFDASGKAPGCATGLDTELLVILR